MLVLGVGSISSVIECTANFGTEISEAVSVISVITDTVVKNEACSELYLKPETMRSLSTSVEVSKFLLKGGSVDHENKESIFYDPSDINMYQVDFTSDQLHYTPHGIVNSLDNFTPVRNSGKFQCTVESVPSATEGVAQGPKSQGTAHEEETSLISTVNMADLIITLPYVVEMMDWDVEEDEKDASEDIENRSPLIHVKVNVYEDENFKMNSGESYEENILDWDMCPSNDLIEDMATATGIDSANYSNQEHEAIREYSSPSSAILKVKNKCRYKYPYVEEKFKMPWKRNKKMYKHTKYSSVDGNFPKLQEYVRKIRWNLLLVFSPNLIDRYKSSSLQPRRTLMTLMTHMKMDCNQFS